LPLIIFILCAKKNKYPQKTHIPACRQAVSAGPAHLNCPHAFGYPLGENVTNLRDLISNAECRINAVYLRKFGIEVPVFHYAVAVKALSFGEGLGEATSAIS